MGFAEDRLGISRAPSTGTLSWEPARYHAQLIRHLWPLTVKFASDLSRTLGQEDTRLDPTTTRASLFHGKYESFELPQLEDWRPQLPLVALTHFYGGPPRERRAPVERIPATEAYPELAPLLAMATRAINTKISEYGYSPSTRDSFRDLLRSTPAFYEALRNGTLLGDIYEKERGVSGVADAFTHTMRSSCVSFGQAIAMLSRLPVPGFTDGRKLARAIVAGGALNELALLAPNNMLGPMCRDGQGFDCAQLLVPRPDGGVALSPELRGLLVKEQQLFRTQLAAQPRSPGWGNAGEGCPMARRSKQRPSGIDLMAKPFLTALEQLGGPTTTPVAPPSLPATAETPRPRTPARTEPPTL